MTRRIIDVHNHFYPDAYLREVARDSTATRVSVDAQGVRRIHYAGDYSVVAQAHFDLSCRLADIDGAEVDMQILSLTVPGVHFEEPDRGIALARLTNDAFGEIVRDHPERFGAFATLPMQAPKGAALELERAVTKLGLAGAMLFSNMGGAPLDAAVFWPVYEAAEALGVPLLVHPTAPASLFGSNMEDLRLVALLGFPFDVTLAAARVVLSGMLDRFPRLTFIMSQLGGALPMLAERIERGFTVYPELTGSLQQSPSDYFRSMYYDTVPYGRAGTPLTIDFAGPERVVLASDHPHAIGDLANIATIVNGLELTDEAKGLIRAGNLERLLGL
jgi:aminocarboxymuconate-semialdehyde decarboxylase